MADFALRAGVAASVLQKHLWLMKCCSKVASLWLARGLWAGAAVSASAHAFSRTHNLRKPSSH